MFLIRPKPFIHESLSSWRHRSGMANGFRHMPLPVGQRSKSDPDRIRNDEVLNWLSNEFFITKEEILALTLDKFSGSLSKQPFENGKQRWILPLGHYRRPALSGPTYCPDCLKVDTEPYFRLSWRFAFLTHCSIHGCILMDRCPNCSSLVWPASCWYIDSSKWNNLRFCRHCGSDLSAVSNLNIFHAEHFISQQLLDRATGVYTSPPHEAVQNNEYFNALWSLCQLIIRRRTSKLQEYLPPFRFAPYPIIAGASSTIEHFKVTERFFIVSSAAWLLQEWPDRFINICEEAKITSWHFHADRDSQPPWMRKVIDQDLSKRKRGTITIQQVDQTIQQLKMAGRPVTKTVVRRTLGVSESLVINSVIAQRRHATQSELIQILKIFDDLVMKTSLSRSQQASLIRDYTIFILSILLGSSVDSICKFSKAQVIGALSEIKHTIQTNHLGLSIFHKALDLHSIYANEIRHSFANDKTATAWFISRFGSPVAAHGVRIRLARMIRSTLPTDLWNSADVFLHTLSSPILGRRARKALAHKLAA